MRARLSLRGPLTLLLLTLVASCGGTAAHDLDVKSDVAVGAGDVDPAAGVVAGGPDAVGESFHAAEDDPVVKAARLAQEKTARAEQTKLLLKTLPRGTPEKLWAKAEAEEKKQNWKTAEDHYRAFALRASADKRASLATEKAMNLAFRRGEYGDGIDFYELVFLDVEEPVLRAKYARLLAATMLSIPHWGTTRGGAYLRGR